MFANSLWRFYSLAMIWMLVGAVASGCSEESYKSASGPCPHKSQFSETDCALKLMVDGYAAYSAPQDLKLGEEKDVQLVLAARPKDIQNVKQWAEHLNEENNIQTGGGNLRVSGTMDAKLTGDGFQIDLINSQSVQPVSWTEPTVWKWKIRALEGDDWFPRFSTNRSLTLAVSAVVGNSGNTRLITTFERDITVHVTTTAWTHRAVEAGKDLWWIWTTAIAAIGAFIAWLRRKKKQ